MHRWLSNTATLLGCKIGTDSGRDENRYQSFAEYRQRLDHLSSIRHQYLSKPTKNFTLALFVTLSALSVSIRSVKLATDEECYTRHVQLKQGNYEDVTVPASAEAPHWRQFNGSGWRRCCPDGLREVTTICYEGWRTAWACHTRQVVQHLSRCQCD